MDMREKLERLQVLVVDELIEKMEGDGISAMELQAAITMLNHNKVVAKAEEDEGTHSKVKRLVRKNG